MVTDEPDKSIDQATASPEPAAADSAADSAVGPADAAPASAPATGADSPIEAGAPTESPDETPPELAGGQTDEAESPAEPVEAAMPGPPDEAAAAQPPADSRALPTAPQAEAEADKTPEQETPEAAPVESVPQAGAAQPAPKGADDERESSAAERPAEVPEEVPKEEKQEEKQEDKEEEEEKSDEMDWYILKVQSNREDSIREGLLRRVAIAGLGRYFGEVIVPMEQVTEFKAGKKRVTKRKLYPGYLVVQMEINDDTWFLVRETPGIGDFTGAAGHPTPMQPHEVARILATHEDKDEEAPKLKIAFRPGDHVKINEGTFENFEGEVDTIDETNGRVTVMINIFGRSTPVELEYWQIESV